MSDFSVLNPTLASILTAFRLDKEYMRGCGNYLYDAEGREYLDFIAQYGSVPFGYNPEFIWQALMEVRQAEIPSFVQPSTPVWAVKLAERLISLAPGNMKYVTFTQSGTEAVEAAIKMARSATGRPIIISTHNSFHGKTLGALSATGKDVYQAPFFAPAPGFIRVEFNNPEALERAFSSYPDQVAAFIVEPVQGEGGIQVARPGYLKACEDICHRHGALLIIDEIQTGLGRTGNLFASEKDQLVPDIITIAKAIGGGMLPLGACLSGEDAWNDDYGHYHSSTFANNNLTCAVGLAVIDHLLANNGQIVREVGEKGNYLLERCQEMMGRYPEVVKEVRGQGLMIGFEFFGDYSCESFDMSFMLAHEGFSALLAGYLLNIHGIRVAPYLNDSMTLRLEPPLTITYPEMERMLVALEDICRILQHKDYAALYGYLVGQDKKTQLVNYRGTGSAVIGSELKSGEEPDRKFAFLIHYPGPQDLVRANPSFAHFSAAELEELLAWGAINPGVEVVCHLPAIRSADSKIAEGWLIGVSYGARQMKEFPRQQVVESIQEAVDLARDLGAQTVGLGAYTSVVTRGGRDCQERGVGVTSGNSFTIVMAMEALWEGSRLMQIDPATARGAVLGATGAIGRVCALLMAEEIRDLVLMGNPEHAISSKNRLRSLTVDIMSHSLHGLEQGRLQGVAGWLGDLRELLTRQGKVEYWQRLTAALDNDERGAFNLLQEICQEMGCPCPVVVEMDTDQVLPGCDLIIAASSSPDYLIYPQHLKPGAVVCDVARPEDIAPQVYELRNDVLLLEGGLVSFPDAVSFGANMGYRPGVGLACLSETMLLCLEGDFNDHSIGQKIPLETVEYLRGLAKKHGFGLAALRSSDRELTTEEVGAIYQRAQAIKRQAV
ncbi:MAG: aminotransferase class III-fold pyridoxal phosphate-dependent enzyme [Methylocystaceae bacterium]